jgi:serine/threonine protein kinase
MINAQGIPCLADFGLSSIAGDIYSVSGSNAASGGSVRWSAPELVGSITARQETWVKPTTQSDIYSLAMVIIEVIYEFPIHRPSESHEYSASRLKVFTGKVPFPHVINVQVIIMMSKGERPQKPAGGEALGLGSALWRLTEECWLQNAERRPDIDNVHRRFQAILDAGKCTD